MKKFILSLIITLVCIFKLNSSNLTEYNSIAEVKTLNYQLFEDIGFDEEKINFVSRVIYSIYKKASSSVTNNSSELNINELIKSENKEIFLKLLSPAEYKKLISVRNKIK